MKNSNYEIRKCTCSDEALLVPVSRELEIYNSVVSYRCNTCSKIIKITPMGSIGTLFSVGVLAVFIIAYLQLSGAGRPGWGDYAIVLFSVLFLAAIIVPPLLKHRCYPTMPSERHVELSVNDEVPKHMVAKLIYAIEWFGFLNGMLAPILFIAGVLGIAALIGYINFLFFQ